MFTLKTECFLCRDCMYRNEACNIEVKLYMWRWEEKDLVSCSVQQVFIEWKLFVRHYPGCCIMKI